MNKSTKNNNTTKIREDISNLKRSILNLNFQKSSGQLEKTSEIKKARRSIARLKTQITKLNGENNA